MTGDKNDHSSYTLKWRDYDFCGNTNKDKFFDFSTFGKSSNSTFEIL